MPRRLAWQAVRLHFSTVAPPGNDRSSNRRRYWTVFAALADSQLNHYGVAALSALTASGMYVLTVTLMFYLSLGGARYSAAFIASVLFLQSGFPLIAGLSDLLQHQTVAAVNRLAHGVMMLLAVAFGFSIVIEIVGIEVSRQPPSHIPSSCRRGRWPVFSLPRPSRCYSIALHLRS